MIKSLLSRMSSSWKLKPWSWQDGQRQKNLKSLDVDVDDVPVRGRSTLSDIYQRHNVAIL